MPDALMDAARQPLWLTVTQLVLLLGLFWVRYLYHPAVGETVSAVVPIGADGNWDEVLPGGWLYGLIKSPMIANVGAGLLIIWNGTAISRSISRNLIFPIRTYLPLTIYITAATGVLFSVADTSAVIASAFVVSACVRLLPLSTAKGEELGMNFRYGFLLGMAPLFHPPSVLCLIMIPFTSLIFRRSAREGIMAFTGFCIPLLSWAYILWATGGSFTAPFVAIWEQSYGSAAGLTEIVQGFGTVRLMVMALFAFIAIMAGAGLWSSRGETRTRTVRVGNLMLVFFFFSVATLLSVPSSAGIMAIAAIPIAFTAPYFFIRFKGIYAYMVYLLLIGGLLTANIIPFAG